MFALSQAAPGPNVLIVSLIGWKAAGVAGAVVAMAAMCAPSSVLTYFVAHAWDRFRDAPLRIAIQHGLAPVTVGLILAAGYVLTRDRRSQLARLRRHRNHAPAVHCDTPASAVDTRRGRRDRRAGPGMTWNHGSGIHSVSPGIRPIRCPVQSSFARSIRSLLDDTKFHQMKRGPSSASPPATT